MPRFSDSNVRDVLELHQLVTEWCAELDTNYGLEATQFFTEDCVVRAGSIVYDGHAAMRAFYEHNAQAHRDLEAVGGRSTRHTFVNFGANFAAADRATVRFIIINYTGLGKTPVADSANPTIVTDVRFECRRDANLDWRVAEFYGDPILLGDDPFLKASMLGG